MQGLKFLDMGFVRKRSEAQVMVEGLQAELSGARSELSQKDEQLRELQNEVDELRKGKAQAEEEGELWKRLSTINGASGFETFRRIGKRDDPSYNWEDISFDEGVYVSVARELVREVEEAQAETPAPIT